MLRSRPVVEQHLRHEHTRRFLGDFLRHDVGQIVRVSLRQVNDFLLQLVYSVEQRFVVVVGRHTTL